MLERCPRAGLSRLEKQLDLGENRLDRIQGGVIRAEGSTALDLESRPSAQTIMPQLLDPQ